MTLRSIAPAGAPISSADLADWVGRVGAWPNAGDALREVLRTRFGAGQYFLLSTGRAAMTVVLSAMRRLAPDHRDEVLIPSYTCYSVAASAIKAGLKVRIVDINAGTLDYEPESLRNNDFSRVLAIVATNLYGLPNDLPAWSRLARERGVFLVDDAAQAMNASVEGRLSGTWGDAGLFSFDKGKNVCAIDGGVLSIRSDDLSKAVEAEMITLPRPTMASRAAHAAKAFAYFAMLRQSLYGVVTRVPGLGLGPTIFTTEFPHSHPDDALSALAVRMMNSLDEFTEARKANAAALLQGLANVPSVSTIAPVAGSDPVFLRLPILCRDHESRERAIASLNAAGIGATGSYPESLADVPEVRAATRIQSAADGGRCVARRLVTLPTHPFVTSTDIARAVDVLGSAVQKS